MKLAQKNVLITGASRGIGRDIALAMAREGANIAVNYAGSEAKALEVVEEIKALGREAFAIQCDVARRIAQSLRFELLPSTREMLTTRATANPTAYEAYLIRAPANHSSALGSPTSPAEAMKFSS